MTSRADGPIVLATGGTGGHVFPAQALARTLIGRGYRLVLVTDRRGSSYGGLLGDLETHRIRAAGISGRGLTARISAVLQLGLGLLQARRLLKQLRPRAVVGFGGYPSVPTMVAAAQLRFKTVIHEQNAVLGRANRVLAPRAGRIATAFDTVAMLQEADAARAVRTGNPVRPEIVAAARPYQPPGSAGAIEILVTGGSQGASIFADIIPAALAALPADLRSRLHVTQQCRGDDIDDVRDGYAASGIAAELATFITDIPERLARAHLVICRSGASTVAELAAAGRPAVMIPYPHAIDDHQRENAARLCDAGGGWQLPQSDATAAALCALIGGLLADPGKLTRAAACAARIGAPDATERLADVVCELIGDVPRSASAEAGQP
ncbi:MAG: undecaprenyldiphospho-muramoylpentapeptide beta-N-acetylglucosaminyltransferase, partial [Alphaproteobacteria bacterium]|nr:undecaprenyldiphospho-muramoylpentapeptide beta-N-acetylglucosaminyltransferase [Alphaproteobacteria bacterium]